MLACAVELKHLQADNFRPSICTWASLQEVVGGVDLITDHGPMSNDDAFKDDIFLDAQFTYLSTTNCRKINLVLAFERTRTSPPKVVWEECVATPHGRECTRPLRVLAADKSSYSAAGTLYPYHDTTSVS